MTAEERVVLVDRDGHDLFDSDGALRTLGKTEAHLRGVRHRAVSVFIFDGDRLLLQKRADCKYHSAGLWTNSCCTHPRPGESPAAAASRRLREEMGVECELRELFQFPYEASVGDGVIENEYDHVFVGTWSGSPTPDAAEVSEWRWIGRRELELELEREPQTFTYWMKECVQRVFASVGR